MTVDFWWTLGQIILVNLLLSGDNAAVIALASRHLPDYQRRWAVWGGSGAAVVLRIGLTYLATSLLQVPGLASLGGALLLWVAYRLMVEVSHEDSEPKAHGGNGWAALRIILVADLLMSLDNVLSLAALAKNDMTLLVLGLLTSLPLIVLGSSLLLRAFARYPWLIRGGVALLAQVAGSMMIHDVFWHDVRLLQLPWVTWIFSGACALGVVLLPTARRH